MGNLSDFKKSMAVEGSSDRQRLLALKAKYDRYEISEDEISNEDKEELIKLYDEETARINAEIERKKEIIRKEILRKRKEGDNNNE